MATQADHTDCLQLLLASGAPVDDISIVCVLHLLLLLLLQVTTTSLLLPLLVTRAKQAQACKTATCLRISDIFTYLFRYLLIHSITY